MEAVIVSAVASAILTILHAFGVFVSRWALVRRDIDKRIFDKLEEEGVPNDGRRLRDTILDMRATEIRQKVLRIISGIMPGPELSFLALTITVSLFLAFNYSSTDIRNGLCPWFVAHNAAFPVFLALILVSIIVWLATSIWREVIRNGAQKKWRKTSMVTMLALGAGMLGAYIYLIMAGR